MNYLGLYSLVGICLVCIIFFLIKNSRPTVTQRDDEEDNKEQMMQHNSSDIMSRNDSELLNDNELIAVISAAIAASMGGQSNLVVRSIRRVYDPTPVWAQIGRNDVMASRL